MRKLLSLIIIATLVAGTSYGQFGKDLLNKVKNKTEGRANRKTDEAIDKALDKAEGKSTSKSETEPTATTETAKAEKVEKTEEPALQSFSKFDFVPGEQVIYYDNFDGEAIAELPTGWNTNGSGEVVTLDKFKGNWLRVHAPFIYLTSNTKGFTENFTMEFDIIMQLKSNGWMYPEVKVGFFATKDESTTANSYLNEYDKNAAVIATFSPGEYKSSKVRLNSMLNNKDYFHSEAKPIPAIEQFYGKPLHISIQVQKERFRMWVNEEKVFDVPKGVAAEHMMNQMFFKIMHTNYKDDQYAMYVSNIKVATGKPDARHKLVEEGKFSTTGILFDVNSATIRPESNGTLKEIADVMKKFPEIKVKIVGHTDSDGGDAANLDLSKKRAAAVKNALTAEFGIEDARMVTDGKGESQPVGDNKVKEGKAQNRRVEFIKQ
jgi:OmpA-OmpF porin, OOP family